MIDAAHRNVPVGTIRDHEGDPRTLRRDYAHLLLPEAEITRDQIPLLRKILDDAEQGIIACEAESAEDECERLVHEAWRDGESDEAPESQCRACSTGITLLGGTWTADDGTTCCYNTGIAPYVPHVPKEG